MGKKSNPVVVIEASDLTKYKLSGKVATKVIGDDSLNTIGGVPGVVYPVTDAQIESGEFSIIGGDPISITQVSGRGQESSRWAMPVYHVGVGAWPVSGSAVGGTVLLHDTFTDTNGTSLDAHAISPVNTPSTAWTERSGNWDIQSNRANSTGASPGGAGWIATLDVGQADYTLSLVFNSATGAGGVVVRYNPADGTHYLINLAPSNDSLRLFYFDGSLYGSALAEDFGVFDASTDYEITVRVTGQTIEAAASDMSRFIYEAATNNTSLTHAGLRATVSSATFDDLIITTPNAIDTDGAATKIVGGEFVVPVPQNNGIFYDGTNYWLFIQKAGSLRCLFGVSLSSLSWTGNLLVNGIGGESKAYSVVFGQVSGEWYAWVLVDRSAYSSGETSNVYRWKLTSGGLSGEISHIDSGTDTPAISVLAWLTKDYGGAAVSELLRCVSSVNFGDNRQIQPDLNGDTDAIDWDPANIDFPEHQLILKISDGYISIANNEGAGDTIDAYEVTKSSIGAAWSAETALGWTNQLRGTGTSHAGQTDFVQLDDGTIYGAYCDDTHGDYGLIVLNKRDSNIAGSWSNISNDVIGGGVAAWHISLSTDGEDVWIFYVKNSGGSRGTSIYYKKYDASAASVGSETKLSDITAGRVFNRMFTQFRAANGIIPAAWSEAFGGIYYVRSSIVLV